MSARFRERRQLSNIRNVRFSPTPASAARGYASRDHANFHARQIDFISSCPPEPQQDKRVEAPRKKHFGRARARRVDTPILSFFVVVVSIRRDKSVASPLFACKPAWNCAKHTPAHSCQGIASRLGFASGDKRKGAVAESFAFSDVANLGDAS